MRRLDILFGLLLLTLAAAPAAGAAEVQQSGNGVVVVGLTSDPRNDLTLTQAGPELIVEDAAAPLSFFGDCRREGPNRVVCPMPRQTRLNVSTSNADDSVTMRLAADAPPADVYTNGGADTLTGGPGVESLNGGDGNDTIVPAGGQDSANGEAGDDTIDTRDAPPDADAFDQTYRDRVLCDGGNDKWLADQVDYAGRDRSAACEAIDRPPGRFVPGGTLVLRARAATVVKNRVTFPVRCAAGSPCRGRLRLAEQLTIVAEGRIALAPGRSGRMTMPLTRQGKRLLDRRASLKLLAFTEAPNDFRRRLGFVRLRRGAR